jgi:hypothetical protein
LNIKKTDRITMILDMNCSLKETFEHTVRKDNYIIIKLSLYCDILPNLSFKLHSDLRIYGACNCEKFPSHALFEWLPMIFEIQLIHRLKMLLTCPSDCRYSKDEYPTWINKRWCNFFFKEYTLDKMSCQIYELNNAISFFQT